MSNKENIENFFNSIPGFYNWTDADKIRLFAWYVHKKNGKSHFQTEDIRRCYDELSLQKPKDISTYLSKMYKRRPKEVIRSKNGYVLEKRLQDHFKSKFGQRQATIAAEKLLLELPNKVPNLTERDFLDESIRCFKCQAFRAAIVMVWNLSYDHLCEYIISDMNRITLFNSQLARSFPRARIQQINTRDDFSDLKESEVLQVCRSAHIISNDLHKILKEKLDKRNTAAHPSTVVISPHTSEEFIIDIVGNVVLKLI